MLAQNATIFWAILQLNDASRRVLFPGPANDGEIGGGGGLDTRTPCTLTAYFRLFAEDPELYQEKLSRSRDSAAIDAHGSRQVSPGRPSLERFDSLICIRPLSRDPSALGGLIMSGLSPLSWVAILTTSSGDNPR